MFYCWSRKKYIKKITSFPFSDKHIQAKVIKSTVWYFIDVFACMRSSYIYVYVVLMHFCSFSSLNVLLNKGKPMKKKVSTDSIGLWSEYIYQQINIPINRWDCWIFQIFLKYLCFSKILENILKQGRAGERSHFITTNAEQSSQM